MAPTIADVFPQRKLRSSSLSTPKKKGIISEDVAPKSEVKKRTGRTQTKPKAVVDSPLRGVAQSPKKGTSPIKKRASSVASSPLKSIQLNSPTKAPLRSVLQSPNKRSPVKKLSSPLKTPLRAVLQSPNKTSPLKRTASPAISSPLQSLQLNSPQRPQNSAKQALFEDSPKRILKLNKADSTLFAKANYALTSSLPEEIYGREKQIKKLRDFLENGTQQPKKNSRKTIKRSIYVYGPPGTGKTTCLKRILNELPVGQLKTVFVNCMSIGHSGGIYGRLVDEIFPTKSYSNMNEAKKVLQEELTKAKVTILLVLDEIDQLQSMNEEVLYTIFELPYLPKSNMLLVGIANRLDLTDSILPRLAMRKEKPEELLFPVYSKPEIVGILKSRLDPFLGEYLFEYNQYFDAQFTVWKFNNFSTNQIFCESNVGDFRR